MPDPSPRTRGRPSHLQRTYSGVQERPWYLRSLLYAFRKKSILGLLTLSLGVFWIKHAGLRSHGQGARLPDRPCCPARGARHGRACRTACYFLTEYGLISVKKLPAHGLDPRENGYRCRIASCAFEYPVGPERPFPCRMNFQRQAGGGRRAGQG